MSSFVNPAPVRFESVLFNARELQISYVEARNEGPAGALIINTLIVPEVLIEGLTVELNEAYEALQALLDKGILLVRNPPERLPARPTQ